MWLQLDRARREEISTRQITRILQQVNRMEEKGRGEGELLNHSRITRHIINQSSAWTLSDTESNNPNVGQHFEMTGKI